MFGMVVLFGLFHGVIFLPVILSLLGPPNEEEGDGPAEDQPIKSSPNYHLANQSGEEMTTRPGTPSKSETVANSNGIVVLHDDA